MVKAVLLMLILKVTASVLTGQAGGAVLGAAAESALVSGDLQKGEKIELLVQAVSSLLRQLLRRRVL